jgi:hypothetical protein
MNHVVSEENHNKRYYSRSVGRDRNNDPATIQQYQIDRRYCCEKSL